MRQAALRLALALLAACDGGTGGGGVGSTGTDVGNPATVDLAFTAYPRAVGEAAVGAATVAVERIRLRPAADCEGGAEIELAGPFLLDLFDPDPLAGLPFGSAAYCRFEMTWHRDEATDTAIRLAGTLAGERFEIRSRRNDELRIEAVDGDGFTIDAATLFIAFDLETWLDGVDLSAAERQPDGSIAVGEASNRDLLERFEDNVESATGLFADGDGDGALGGDEHDDDDLLAAGSR